jgi:hypothetical protein
VSYDDWLNGNRAKPFTMAWGGFTVKVQEGRHDQELSIIGQGRIRQRLIAHGLDVDIVPWSGGKTALRIVASNGERWEGGTWTYLYVLSGSRIRNVLKFNGTLDQVRSDASGTHTIAVSDSIIPLGYFTNFCAICCGNILEVVSWRGGIPYLANRDYPPPAKVEAAKRWDQLTTAAKEDVVRYPLHDAEVEHADVVSNAIGYYANEWTIGQGPAAKRRLKRVLGAADWRWFLRSQPELRRRLRTMVSEVTTDRRRVIRIPNAFSDDDD